ncbi:MAG TPA: polymer-forming cytoskeletal protein [Erysipelotrichaceae bacterium]|jgi:cytoskeletal protein CcmA (bactofilin family)|nr:polymer-forming cytoskeletal protein [Erysipelotrichia bacterium]HPX33094.1 polymer-forming cytoskeletal protein [Erysipelotrichaceae bacterium]HQA84374.1 polymer-forming cytoskeletal protein [Erysipelotrichaceae bacterium]
MIDFIDYTDPNTTLILLNTTVEGNVKTVGAIEVYGKINGYVETDGLSSIYGCINGNLETRDLIARTNSIINGDVNIIYDGFIDKSSDIEGNINCKNIEVYGKIYGNIKAEDSVILRSSANVVGDIICKNLVVDQGAKINGNVRLVYQFEKN